MSEKKPTATVKASFAAGTVQETAAMQENKNTAGETTAKRTAGKKETAKKGTTRKTAGKSTPSRTAAAKKPAETEVILQWNGNEYTTARLLQSAKDVWQYDLGKNVADFGTAQIYVKPEEGRAYVVVNGTDELSFHI